MKAFQPTPGDIAEADQEWSAATDTHAKLFTMMMAANYASDQDDDLGRQVAIIAFSAMVQSLPKEKLYALVAHILMVETSTYYKHSGGRAAIKAMIDADEQLPCRFCFTVHDDDVDHGVGNDE